MLNSPIEIPKCTTCGSNMHQIERDDVVEIEGKTLYIRAIPVIVCATAGCEDEYYSGEVLSKLDILKSQFMLQVKTNFMGSSSEIRYPKLILRNKASMYA